MSKHLPALLLIAVIVSIVYSRVSGAYFCGYDDFFDIHRAKFEDTRAPMRMLTTTHFGTPKYRPIERVLIWVSWQMSGGKPLLFRIRNLFFHVVAAGMIYGIAWLMFGSGAVALGAGLLFGLHPLANQSVVVAMWTITSAYALLLAAFFFFLYSLHAKEKWRLPLAGFLVISLVGLFMYEALIVVFGFVYGYLFLWRMRGRRLPPRYGYALVGGSAAVLGSFFAVRHIFVSQAVTMTPLPLMLRNVAMYVAALLLPVDSVFASTVFGTPLPSEVKLSPHLLGIAALALLLLLAGATWVTRRPAMRARLKALDWPELGFLVAAALFGLSPFLVFSGHPSETYLYLPVGLYAILLSRFLFQVSRSTAVYAAVVSVLLVSFTAGTWVKNERVTACGDTAEKILSQLPIAQWQQGSWHLRLASTPDDPPLRRYGIYGYHGLATIELKESGLPAMEMALQVASGNERIKADVVEAWEMAQNCGQAGPCFWISPLGEVKSVAAGN